MSVLRRLLWCGVVGPMVFIVMFLVNDAVKPGYDPVRDAVSEGAIGSGGWLQITNFIVSGLLVAASSAAITRVVDRWTGALVGVAGAGLALAGVFVSDPVPVEHASWHGLIHNVAGTASSAALVITCFVAARWRPVPIWRWYCLAVGVCVPLIFVAALGADGTLGLWQRLSNVIGFIWLAVVALRALAVISETPEADLTEGPRTRPRTA